MQRNAHEFSSKDIDKQNSMKNYTWIEKDKYIEIIGGNLDFHIHLSQWGWAKPELEIPPYLYLVPIFALSVLVINTVVIIVFVKGHLLTSMNVLLIGLAVSNTVTVVCPTPFLMYMFGFGYVPFVPLNLCRVWDYFLNTIPTISHTASIWSTVCLAIHRYLCVCYPFHARRFCSKVKSLKSIAVVYVASCLLHICRFFDTEYIPIETNISNSNSTIVTCVAKHAQWIEGDEILYECIYYWVYVIVVQLIPLTALITLDTIMLLEVRKSDKMRSLMVTESDRWITRNAHHATHARKENVRMTWIIIIIIAIVVIVEVPLAILQILLTLSLMLKELIFSEDILGTTSVVFNTVVYMSYPFIFLLYCTMSRRFKMAFKTLIKC